MTFFRWANFHVSVSGQIVAVRIGWTGRGNKPARATITRDGSLKIAAALIEVLRQDEGEIHLVEGPTTISRRGQYVRISLGEPRWRWRPKGVAIPLSTTGAVVKAFVDAAQAAGSETRMTSVTAPSSYAVSMVASVPASQ